MSDSVNIAANLVGISLVFVLLYVAWPKAVVDSIRHRIFELRDGLFDAAAEGRIAFDDPAYVGFRAKANNWIRYCHELSWPRIAFLSLLMKACGCEVAHTPASNAGSREQRDMIKRKESQLNSLIALAMCARSPLIVLLCVPLVALLVLFAGLLALIPALNPARRYLVKRIKSQAARLSGGIAARSSNGIMVEAPLAQ